MTARIADDPRLETSLSLVAVTGFGLALAAALLEAGAALGSRWGWWDFRTGFSLLRWAAYGGLAAAVVSFVGAIRARPGTATRGFALAALGIAIGLATAWVPWEFRRRAQEVPPIHDITTDTADPPRFEAVVPLRADAPNPVAYGGDSIAVQQREAYPDIVPLVLDAPPARAFERALAAAREMGWEIAAARPGEGRIEATATTFWFGFEDDVVVRVRPAEGGGSRIDVRSKSRVGRSDVGKNAERIREYLAEVRGGA